MSFKVRVPGSIMLLGEHAVLHGFPAVVCAVNRYMTVTLSSRKDDRILIHSDRLGKFETTIESLSIQKPFTFILASILSYQTKLAQGFDLIIESEFSERIGLGSSSAVTLAVHYLLRKLLAESLDPKEIYTQALATIRRVQGVASGADVAASVFGGVIYYCANDFSACQLIKNHLPLHLIYVGYKTPTVEVIAKVDAAAKKAPAVFQSLYEKIGECADLAWFAILQKDFKKLGEIFNAQYVLQVKLGVSDAQTAEIIDGLRSMPLWGSKISGSGLGDCVVALGDLKANTFPQNAKQKDAGILQIDVEISMKGMTEEGA